MKGFKTRLAIFVIAASLLGSSIASARLVDITLRELVAKSGLIVVGETTSSVQTSSQVSFRPIIVLKGSVTGTHELLLCNDPDETEAYDLRGSGKRFVIFANGCGDCYRPVHGLRSTIRVLGDDVETVSIVDQPNLQRLDTFQKKIQDELRD